MKIVGIFLGVAVLVVIFVACVIARNRKAEAERKERLEHIFDDMINLTVQTSKADQSETCLQGEDCLTFDEVSARP